MSAYMHTLMVPNLRTKLAVCTTTYSMKQQVNSRGNENFRSETHESKNVQNLTNTYALYSNLNPTH